MENFELKPKKLLTPFTIINIIIFLGVIANSFYFFYFKRNFDFIVETRCNPDTETCFYRDCSNPDDCPPNGLSYYNTYTIKAYDFKNCSNEDCTEACTLGTINCVKTECTEDDMNQGICVVPQI